MVLQSSGTIDGLYYRLCTWDEPDGFGASCVISQHADLSWWETGCARSAGLDDVGHLAIWDAYGRYAERMRGKQDPQGARDGE